MKTALQSPWIKVKFTSWTPKEEQEPVGQEMGEEHVCGGRQTTERVNPGKKVEDAGI